MTPHRCTGDVDTCAVCSGRRDAIEARRSEPASERQIRRAEARLEARVYGEDRGGY